MSLRHYSQLALKEARLTSEAELSKVQSLEGILQSDRENLILAYAGSFNPPHKGHIDVLLSGLRPEIAAAAIIVVPSEDHFLRNKIRDKHPEFFLEQKRRADILEALLPVPKAKVWVWPSTWYPFKVFMEALVRLTEADGFKTTFLWLIGPDLLNSTNPTMVTPYELPGVLISNRARHIVAHFLPDGKPAVWNGFGEWSRSPSSAKDGESLHFNSVDNWC
ncbi:hypothetical protein N7495_003246 [Penicillium taxi]|uniref:uncharacterized protein n=1 Tax=Penicillium taxi TaxID=168475 RepID=UPI00254599F2|nr:uncharacterized protein N7495_003246 [Penicillium taxi]KAJ5902718.1 hypothetical protein N7495_003246 [Penicillium taxi]